ncbi:MAG: hypothetical protein MZV70_31730 [Desulfobacterales bacterium]|nr:hypothetical protein [Desulfobacterales bacterium]
MNSTMILVQLPMKLTASSWTDKKVENPTKKGEFKEFKKGDPVPTFAWLQDDGSTSSGCWVYCGSVWRKRQPGHAPRHSRSYRVWDSTPEWAWSLAGKPPHHLQRRFC